MVCGSRSILQLSVVGAVASTNRQYNGQCANSRGQAWCSTMSVLTWAYALPAARAGAWVIAFEPDPENASRLRAHVYRNQLQDGIQVVQAAVWSRPQGSISFRRGLPRSQGGVSWQDHHPILASGEVIEVPVCSLDDFARSGAPAPDIITIDVEGAESEVLKGASDVLQTHRPALIVEVHTASELVRVREILQGPIYDTTWDTPPEGFPRACFAVPCRTQPKI